MRRALLLIGAAVAACQQPAAPPERGALLREAIAAISAQALGAERVDWPAVQAELEAALPARATLADEREAIRAAVARLGDPHARFFEPAAPAPSSSGASGGTGVSASAPTGDAAPAPSAFVEGPGAVPAFPQAWMLTHGVAFLLIPGCDAPTPAAGLDYARALRARIEDLAADSPAGWIVDLRLDGGGNLWPMLLGLQPLLGEGICAASVGPGGVVRLGVDARAAWLESAEGARAEQIAFDDPHDAARGSRAAGATVAVLLGPWTMSSGEFAALALRSAARSRSFGEPTAGLTTGTRDFPLRDGSRLVLPVDWMADAAGAAPRGPVRPDQPAPFGDWPLSTDATAQAAQAWLRGPARR